MTIKHTIPFLLAATILSNTTIAQAPIQSMNANPVMADEASFLNPAYLKNTGRLRVNIAPFMNGHIQAANSLLSTGDLIKMVSNGDEESTSSRPINRALNNIRSQNTVNFMLDLTLLHVTSQFGSPESPWHADFSIRQHLQTQVKANDEFLHLLFQGNKQYAGETISLEPRINALGYADFGVSLSKTLTISAFKITPAVRLRYLVGEGAIHTNQTALNLFTEENGEYLDINGHIDGYAGGVINFGKAINSNDDSDSENDDISRTPTGKGFGFDLGVTIEYKNLSLSVASIDNGRIKFKGESAWYISSQNTSYRWEGYDISADLNGHESSENFSPFDSLDLKAVQEDFAVKIGSKFTVNANYGLREKTDNVGANYFNHNFGLSMITGAKSQFNPEKPTWMTIYYQYNLANHITFGFNYNNCLGVGDIGVNFGVRVAGLNIGVGSNSLMAILNPENSRKANAFFHLGFAF